MKTFNFDFALGVISKLCNKCNGVGQVESREVQNGKEIWIICKKCKGKGKIKDC